MKVHIKGFTFTRHSRAWDTLAAGACDAVYGDSFTRDGSRVLGIGNNVSLLFDRMDFGETGWHPHYGPQPVARQHGTSDVCRCRRR